MAFSIDELKVGDKAFFERAVCEEDVYMFSQVTGDFNPIHVDKYACKQVFKKRIAHGALLSGFISACIGMYLPGQGTVYLSQNSRFDSPVYFGDIVKVEVSVTEINTKENIVRLRTLCTNEKGHRVLTGEACVMPPVK